MSAGFILLAAFFIAIPVFVKYFLAFETREMLDTLKQQDREVQNLFYELQALEQERAVLRRAIHQIENQRMRVQTRKSISEESLGRMRLYTVGAAG